jgi:CDP-4-dehydro-6-deoxyglucose reductase, E3
MAFRVAVLETGAVFDAGADESVLDAAGRQGVALRHECTFGICGTCRVRLVEGTVRYDEAPPALSAAEAVQGFALLCQARATSPLVVSCERALAEVAPAARHAAVVREVRRPTRGITQLRLEVPGAEALSYRPGQHLSIHFGDGSQRSFSMAALPDRALIELHVRHVEGGRFTGERLPALGPGDALEIELPLGPFGLHRDDERPLLMVATGTGIAPIKCMLESLLDDDDCPPVSLYWGMRSEADLYLDDLFASWSARLYEFRYVPVVSRAGAGWRGRRGHVQDAVLADIADLSEHSIYLCGAPAMIDEAKARFVAAGAQLDRLYVDAFTFQHAASALAEA